MTITNGIPSIRVREARIVWNFTSNRRMSVGSGIEGNESGTDVIAVL